MVVRACPLRPGEGKPKTKQNGPLAFCACAPAIKQDRWSANYLGRHGCRLRLGDVDIKTFVLPNDVSLLPYLAKVRRNLARIATMQLICSQAEALRNAKALAFEVGVSASVDFGFPVV